MSDNEFSPPRGVLILLQRKKQPNPHTYACSAEHHDNNRYPLRHPQTTDPMLLYLVVLLYHMLSSEVSIL